MSVLTQATTDGLVMAKRNLIKVKRIPDLLIFTTIQPVMFVLLFAYVFGGAIHPKGVNYREYLMAGIFTQTVAFGSAITAIGLADDLQKGIIDRFRSLPMARSAVLVGRTTSDLFNNVVVMIVMSICGLLVGWRIHRGFGLRARRLRHHVRFRIRDVVGIGDHRALGAQRRSRAERGVYLAVPADVHVECVRADGHAAGLVAGSRELESDECCRCCRAFTVRQSGHGTDSECVVDAASGTHRARLEPAAVGDLHSAVGAQVPRGRSAVTDG